MENDLPPIIQEIAGLIGEAGALKVVSSYGGRNGLLFGSVRHDLAALIGPDDARKLIAYFRRVPVSIPLCSANLRHARNEALRERFDILTKTLSARRAVAQLVNEFPLTERHIWRLLKSASE